MSSRSRLAFVTVGLCALVPLIASAASCSSSSGGGTPQADAHTFQPATCGYTVGALDGFPSFDAHKAVASVAPKHVRLGLGGGVVAGAAGYADPSTSFAVVWQTDDASLATQVRWGESETALTHTNDGISYLVEPSLGSAAPDGNRFHEAHVCGLQPGRTYYYQVGGGAPGAEQWSKVERVTTAPAKGATDPVLIGVAGDTRNDGSTPDLPVWKSIAGRFKLSGAHVAVFSGDFVWASALQDLWDGWSRASDDAGGSVFFAMTPGNHENEQFTYYAHVVMPGAVGKNFERYNSFDYGPVHVVSFDDYDGIIAPSVDDTGYKDELLAWLDADLKKADANRANVPWIVTVHHHGLWSSTSHTDRAAERDAMVGAVQPLYDKYKVDVDLAGHDHFYERSKRMVKDVPSDTAGTVYFIVGGGGAEAYSVLPSLPFSAKTTTYDDKTEGLYGMMSVTPTKLSFKAYKLSTATGTTPADDQQIDADELTR
jgi:hypothetical protein